MLANVSLRVDFTNIADMEVLVTLLVFFSDPLAVTLSQGGHVFHGVSVALRVLGKSLHFHARGPLSLVQIKQHLLLEVIFLVINIKTEVVLVQAVI
jgi:hypothetical protein